MNSIQYRRDIANDIGQLIELDEILETPPAMPDGGDIPGALRMSILATIVYLAMPITYEREIYKQGAEILLPLELDILTDFAEENGTKQVKSQSDFLLALSKVNTEEIYDCGVHGGVSVLLGSVASLAAKASSAALPLLSKIAAGSSAYALLPYGMLNFVGGGVILCFNFQEQINGKLLKETTSRVKESMLNVITEVKIMHLTQNAVLQNQNLARQDQRLRRQELNMQRQERNMQLLVNSLLAGDGAAAAANQLQQIQNEDAENENGIIAL